MNTNIEGFISMIKFDETLMTTRSQVDIKNHPDTTTEGIAKFGPVFSSFIKRLFTFLPKLTHFFQSQFRLHKLLLSLVVFVGNHSSVSVSSLFGKDLLRDSILLIFDFGLRRQVVQSFRIRLRANKQCFLPITFDFVDMSFGFGLQRLLGGF